MGQSETNKLESIKEKNQDILYNHLPEEAMKGLQMRIHLTAGATPRRATTSKAIPHHWQENPTKSLKKLLADGVIEPVPIDKPRECVSPGEYTPTWLLWIYQACSKSGKLF